MSQVYAQNQNQILATENIKYPSLGCMPAMFGQNPWARNLHFWPAVYNYTPWNFHFWLGSWYIQLEYLERLSQSQIKIVVVEPESQVKPWICLCLLCDHSLILSLIRGAQTRCLHGLEFCLSWVQPPQQLPIFISCTWYYSMSLVTTYHVSTQTTNMPSNQNSATHTRAKSTLHVTWWDSDLTYRLVMEMSKKENTKV